MNVDLAVILLYLALMATVGIVLSKKSRDIHDYFRAGSKGTWWLVGCSTFMQGFTALTFTGIAGQAFLAGWSVLTIFLAGVVSAYLQAWVVAPLFRQMRATTHLDVQFARFGRYTEQTFGYIGFIMGLMYSALSLVGLSTFVAAVFDVNLLLVILVVGSVIVIYSVSGGSWAVLATDFLQTLILVPTTILVAWLALDAVGWLPGLFAAIEAQGLTNDFAFFKEKGHVSTFGETALALGLFTWSYHLTTMVGSSVNAVNMNEAFKYFAVKTGGDARKAAILAGTLRLAGSFIFFLPPIVARVLMEDQVVDVAGVGNKADTAYAVISMSLLPPGLVGLIVVAMFTATMSSMDTGLTANAGNVTKNLYPAICRLFRQKAVEGAALLRLSRIMNFLLGLLVISIAIQFAIAGRAEGLFAIMLDMAAFLLTPIVTTFFCAMVVKRAPEWAAVFSVAWGGLASFLFFYGQTNLDIAVSWQVRWWVIFLITTGAFLSTTFFWKGAPQAYKDKVDAFFRQMNTPVDFKQEVGDATDYSQFRIIGGFGALIGTAVFLLHLVPGNLAYWPQITFVGGSILGLSVFFIWLGGRQAKG